MFIGHYAVALSAKKAAPNVSLGTLFIAAQLLDHLWPLFLLLGIEHVRIDPGNTAFTPLDLYDYPISHSLATSLGWSLMFGLLYFAFNKNKRGALIIACCVFSHWILDFITHRPDMPLTPGTTSYVGLGLWNSVTGTLIVELGLFIIAVGMYLRTTTSLNRIGTYGFWGLIVFFLAMYIINIVGPPPPSESAIAIGTNAMWLFVAWAYWVDKNRKVSLQ